MTRQEFVLRCADFWLRDIPIWEGHHRKGTQDAYHPDDVAAHLFDQLDAEGFEIVRKRDR